MFVLCSSGTCDFDLFEKLDVVRRKFSYSAGGIDNFCYFFVEVISMMYYRGDVFKRGFLFVPVVLMIFVIFSCREYLMYSKRNVFKGFFAEPEVLSIFVIFSRLVPMRFFD